MTEASWSQSETNKFSVISTYPSSPVSKCVPCSHLPRFHCARSSMSSVPVTSDTVMEKTAEAATNTNVCSERPRPSKSQDEWTSAVFRSVAVAQRKSVASGDTQSPCHGVARCLCVLATDTRGHARNQKARTACEPPFETATLHAWLAQHR